MDEIECPYCKYEFGLSFWDENCNGFTEECPECKKIFYVEVEKEIFYEFNSFRADHLNKEKKNNEPTLFDID